MVVLSLGLFSEVSPVSALEFATTRTGILSLGRSSRVSPLTHASLALIDRQDRAVTNIDIDNCDQNSCFSGAKLGNCNSGIPTGRSAIVAGTEDGRTDSDEGGAPLDGFFEVTGHAP